MSRERIVEIAERGVFRPRSRLWELHDLHVPFDTLSETGDYEQKAVSSLTQGTCVAVIGESGTGKSSVIAWLCTQLPESHLALRIPITGVEDPGSAGEIARLALSITLDGIAFDNRDEKDLQEARADSRTTTRSPVAFNARLGGGAIPAEVGVNTASLQEEFNQDRLEGEHLLALNGRLIPILADAGITPVFVFEDTEATVGADESHERAEAFFAGPLSAFVAQVDAPTIVAVQTHLVKGSRAFGRLAPSLRRLTIPLLENRARRVVDSILTRRLELAAGDDALTSIFDPAGLNELADFYQGSGGDLRRVLAAIHEAAERANSDEAELIALPHVRIGVALWQ